jgi:hypothetical protein
MVTKRSLGITRVVRALAFLGVTLVAGLAFGEGGDRTTVDRTALRYTSPETGGTAKPRFLTEHEVAFFARLESLVDDGQVSADFYERYQKVAVLRLIAEEMLSELQIEGGSEPPKLPVYAAQAREALNVRAGGPERVTEARIAEGISEAEVSRFMLKRARAMVYIDRGAKGLFAPSDEELFSAWRTLSHPYKGARFEEMRARFIGYYAYERFRTLELDFVQSARSRVVLSYL